MKSFMELRLKQALANLKTLEKNCHLSKKGFKPNPIVCMYLIECIMPVVDIYPTNILSQINVETSFNKASDLLAFLDATIGRMKRAEFYALSKEEIEEVTTEKVSITAYEFLFQPNFNPQGQLEKFLRDLLERLEMINQIMSDPRRSQAKISYLDRTFVIPITYVASVLEAISVGIANV